MLNYKDVFELIDQPQKEKWKVAIYFVIKQTFSLEQELVV